jgi:ATP-binding cassette subfamily B protein
MRTSWSLMFVSMLSIRIARAQASADRIQEVLDSAPYVQNRSGIDRAPSIQGRVAFENVSFSYNGDCQDPVLKEITFTAEPGETVAVLGATGSGKSSLIHLIPRFYDVTEGAVKIDGTDVRDLDKATLRQNIGVALQESVLFSGTIRENIRYGRPDASEAEVIAAAKAAQAHAFITSFPDRYDTILGQRGVNLSGGQKQRVAIARALLVEPAILILDDSTSAVDVETEAEIQEALEALMTQRRKAPLREGPSTGLRTGPSTGLRTGPSAELRTGPSTELRTGPKPSLRTSPTLSLRTSFVIAQRISTVLNADKILVLDEGSIVAEGTHDELMTSSAIYREIYDSQLGDGAAADGGATYA